MYSLLTRLRLHWYALSTGRVLLRHWQGLVLVTLLLPAVRLMDLLRGTALPLTAMFSPGHGLLWHLGYVALIQSVTLAWVMLQRKPISGNDFMRYAAALPISITVHRYVNLILLFLANSILWVPMVIAITLSSASQGRTDGVFHVIALVVLLVLILITQLAALEKNWTALPGILAANLLFSISLTLADGIAAWLLLPLATLSAVSFLSLRWPDKISMISASRTTAAQMHYMRPRLHWVSPVLRIQLKAMSIAYPGSTALRISMALGVAVIANLFIQIFEFDNRSLPTAIIAMAAMAMILSGTYRTLHSMHMPMRSYLAALPLGRHYWAIRDTLFVILLGAHRWSSCCCRSCYAEFHRYSLWRLCLLRIKC